MWQGLLSFLAGVLPALTQAAKTVMAFLAGEAWQQLNHQLLEEKARADALQARSDVEAKNAGLSPADVLGQLRADTERRKKPRTGA